MTSPWALQSLVVLNLQRNQLGLVREPSNTSTNITRCCFVILCDSLSRADADIPQTLGSESAQRDMSFHIESEELPSPVPLGNLDALSPDEKPAVKPALEKTAKSATSNIAKTVPKPQPRVEAKPAPKRLPVSVVYVVSAFLLLSMSGHNSARCCNAEAAAHCASFSCIHDQIAREE